MAHRIILAAAYLVVSVLCPVLSEAKDVRQANKGESCASFRKTCTDACPVSGGGGVSRKKCVDSCTTTYDGCAKSGTWDSTDLQVKGLATVK